MQAARIDELYGQEKPVFSFEFFPPKDDDAAHRMMQTLDELGSMLEPDFVSVTYGAGGSTRGRTVGLVKRIQEELGLTAMAHATCVGHSSDELGVVLDRLYEGGIRNVLALRGDPPAGETVFRQAKGGFAHGSELVELVAQHGGFSVGGACYPESHPESVSAEADLKWTVHKVRSGARFLISQLFFDDAHYFRFVDRARSAGVEVPIVPGIMPITNVAQIERFTKMCGAGIPGELHERLTRYQDDPSVVMAIGIEHAIRQCRRLLEGGAPGIHFYTLNKSHATRSILAAIKGV
ncbi:MAG: methylenetetrahydrofolate reductase [NAD(P)H] [Planctomycetes bacterium]|jgi:methylenetetrahydrofolate reductase (NADPH)|nr:methylenetetrahydrofolate reductase [NAD(P)H] [Planctomycetota bacterium]